MDQIKPQVSYQDFAKVDIRVGTIVKVEEIPDSEKLLKLKIDFGELGEKQILSGIKKWYSPEDLLGSQACFAFNIEPRQMMGLISEGMILAVTSEDASKPILLAPKEITANGLGVN